METKSLAEILKAAILAGLIAGFCAAGFHWIFTEPLIDRAIEIEGQRQDAAATVAEPVVSRPVQKVGLFAGFLIYGAAWGILFGALVYAVRPWFAETAWGKQGFILALLLGWAVAIFPLLKYPANPPGVGEPETIGYRQELFLGFIALSLVGTFAALGAERSVRHSSRARAIVLVAYLIYLALIFLALPSNPDAVKLPAALVGEFRLLSLAGQLLFWIAMGGVFGWLCRKFARALTAPA
ncbi:MAG TPA: CbtA family protein [Candidatus Binatia bacterium]